MPAEQKQVVVYEGWRKGPWHSLGPDKGPEMGHDYDCMNMQLYANGTLGPRPYLVKMMNGVDMWGTTQQTFKGSFWYQNSDYSRGPLNVLAASDARFQIVDGTATQYAYDHSASAATTMSVDLSTFRTLPKPARYTTDGGAAAWDAGSEGQISSMPYEPLGDKHMIVGGDGYFKDLDNVSGDTYQAITAGTGGSANNYPANWDPACLTQWRDRFWSWGDYDDGSNYNGNRIHYSDVGDIATWQTNSYIDVGADPNLPIIGVWQVFDNLLIAMADNKWYKYSFTDDPDFGELKYIGTKVIPDFYVTTAVTGAGLVFITRESGLVIATKDQIDDQTFRYVRIPTDLDDQQEVYFIRGMTSVAENAICLPYKVESASAYLTSFGSAPPYNVYKGDRSLDLVNGVWVHSLYSLDTGANKSAFIDAVPMGNDHWGFFASELYNTSDSNDDTLYVRPVTLNRPSNSNDTFGGSSERQWHTNSTTDITTGGQVWLGTFKPEDGATAIIESITFDYDYWYSSGFPTPGFKAYADMTHGGDEWYSTSNGHLLGEMQAAPDDADGLGEDPNDTLNYLSTATYWPQRARTTFHPARHPAATEIRIRIDDVASIAFHSITVEYTLQGVPHKSFNLV